MEPQKAAVDDNNYFTSSERFFFSALIRFIQEQIHFLVSYDIDIVRNEIKSES